MAESSVLEGVLGVLKGVLEGILEGLVSSGRTSHGPETSPPEIDRTQPL